MRERNAFAPIRWRKKESKQANSSCGPVRFTKGCPPSPHIVRGDRFSLSQPAIGSIDGFYSSQKINKGEEGRGYLQRRIRTSWGQQL